MNGLIICSKIRSFSVNFVTLIREMDGPNFDKDADSIEAVRGFIQSCYEYASIYFITRHGLFLRHGVSCIIFLYQNVLLTECVVTLHKV